MPTRVKICGITRPEDAALAAELGADAIGLNFFAGPRRVDAQCAKNILEQLPPLVSPIALTAIGLRPYVDAPSPHEIRNNAWGLGITTFQIYGEVPDQLIEGRADLAFWVVHSVQSRESLADVAAQFYVRNLRPRALLLDTASKHGQLGGTGESFNWHWIAEARDAGELTGLPPIILAGGLTPDNVATAIRITRPYAVDVSSGVEAPGKPGIKDPIKLRDFIQAAKAAL